MVPRAAAPVDFGLEKSDEQFGEGVVIRITATVGQLRQATLFLITPSATARDIIERGQP
jgi:hypothetical protein